MDESQPIPIRRRDPEETRALLASSGLPPELVAQLVAEPGLLRIKVTVEREDGSELHFFYPMDRPVRFGDRVVLEFTVGDVSEL